MIRNHVTVVSLSAAVVLAAAPARAQFVPKAPEKPAATPEFTPPAPPAPPPPPPPSTPPPPPEPLPSLAVKDESGKLKPLPASLEESALRAFTFDPETWKKLDASMAARRLDLDWFVAENVDKVEAARAARDSIETTTDINDLIKIREKAQPLAGETLLNRLMKDGALTFSQKQRVEQVVRDYQTAARDERKAELGSDWMKISRFVATQSINDIGFDSFASLERQVADLRTAFVDMAPGLSAADGWDQSVVQGLKSAAMMRDTGQNFRRKFFELPVEQQTALLKKRLPPKPAAASEPAKPQESKPGE